MWIAKLFYSCVHRTLCVWIVFNGHKSTLKKASWSSSTQRTYRSFHRPIFVKFTREPNNFCCWRCCCLVVVFSVTMNTCFCVFSHCERLFLCIESLWTLEFCVFGHSGHWCWKLSGDGTNFFPEVPQSEMSSERPWICHLFFPGSAMHSFHAWSKHLKCRPGISHLSFSQYIPLCPQC